MSSLKYFRTCVFLTEFLKLEVQKTTVISPLQGEIAGHFDILTSMKMNIFIIALVSEKLNNRNEPNFF